MLALQIASLSPPPPPPPRLDSQEVEYFRAWVLPTAEETLLFCNERLDISETLPPYQPPVIDEVGQYLVEAAQWLFKYSRTMAMR